MVPNSDTFVILFFARLRQASATEVKVLYRADLTVAVRRNTYFQFKPGMDRFPGRALGRLFRSSVSKREVTGSSGDASSVGQISTRD